MKRNLFTLLLLFCSLVVWGQKAKYIFYFIGDGMGVNQVNGTESWLAANEDRIGIVPLQFAQFPNVALVTTFSGTNGVTDSAASGTALASGEKTKNGTIGMLADQTTPIKSVAHRAKDKGMKVGVTTTVSVDHATPSAFYAHQTYRGKYHEIGKDLVAADFDFYAGSDFLKPESGEGDNKVNLYDLTRKAGYTVVKGYDDYLSKNKKAKKILLLQSDERNAQVRASLPYAIDQTEADLCQAEIVSAAIEFLMKDGGKKNGFFLMSEGGKIDFACHANDAATVFHEVVDMDKAVQVAYDFYLKHPDETLIVVTADHETGGLVLGRGSYEQNLKALTSQKMSINAYSNLIKQMRKETDNDISWDMLKESLEENFGFWKEITLNEAQEKRLKRIHHETMEEKKGELDKTLYQSDEPIATASKQIMNEVALIGWVSGGHSNGYVPAFAIGAGSELFHGRIDNTDVPKLISEAAGIDW